MFWNNKFKRAWYIAKLYKSACEAYPAFEYTPIDFGWKQSECSECLDIKWFEGPQVSIEIDQIDESDVADDANSDGEYEEDNDGEVDESESDDDDGLTFFLF